MVCIYDVIRNMTMQVMINVRHSRLALSVQVDFRMVFILFTDGGGKLLLTQVVSPRYSIQDDGVLFFLFELCECLRIVVSDY